MGDDQDVIAICTLIKNPREYICNPLFHHCRIFTADIAPVTIAESSLVDLFLIGTDQGTFVITPGHFLKLLGVGDRHIPAFQDDGCRIHTAFTA